MSRNPLVNNYAFIALGDADRNRQMMARDQKAKSICADFLKINASLKGATLSLRHSDDKATQRCQLGLNTLSRKKQKFLKDLYEFNEK